MSTSPKDILKSLHSYKRATERVQSNNPVIQTGTNPLEIKAWNKLIDQVQWLVTATTNNTWIDIIPETAYADLAAQIIATPNNGATKNTSTWDLVIKDISWDYLVLTTSAVAARYSETVTAVANVAFTVTHWLWAEDIVVVVKDAVTKEFVYPDITILDSNNVEITITESWDFRVTCI